jgi:hypothetical protein
MSSTKSENVVNKPLMCGSFFQLQLPHRMVTTVANHQEILALEGVFSRRVAWPHTQIFKVGWMEKSGYEKDRVEFKRLVKKHFGFLDLDIEWDVPLPQSNIRITFATNMNKSIIGRDAVSIPRDEPTMWLGGTTDRGAVIHQFGHVLGMTHEMNVKAQGIDIYPQVIIAYMKSVYDYDHVQIRDGIMPSFTQVLSNVPFSYDKKSVMNYAYAYFTNKQLLNIPYKAKLSDHDRKWLTMRFHMTDSLNTDNFKFGASPTNKKKTSNVILISILSPVLFIILILCIVMTAKKISSCQK